MPQAYLFLDLVLASLVIFGCVQCFNRMSPLDGLARVQTTRFIVQFLDQHRWWYFPLLVGITGALTSLFLYVDLLATGCTVWVCGLILAFGQYRIWKRMQLPVTAPV